MNFRALAARFAMMVACAIVAVVPMQAAASKSRGWQCAPYAREISNVKIQGNAYTWWDQAAGRYKRGADPEVGAIMSFKKTGKNRYGHVAMVSKVVNEREVLLTHANWSYSGAIERNVRAIDVSAKGDWSEVRVWYGPQKGMGISSYPVNGFIYGGAAGAEEYSRAPSLELDLSDLVLETNI